MIAENDGTALLLTALARQLTTDHARVEEIDMDTIGARGRAQIQFTYQFPLVTQPESDKDFRERILSIDKGRLSQLEFALAMIVTGEALDKIGGKLELVRTPSTPIVRDCP